MSDCVRMLTPVERAKAEVLDMLERKDVIPDGRGIIDGLDEIFECALKYESEYASKHVAELSNMLACHMEENRLLKVQLKVLTKYIESHNI